ncbi:MAG: cyclopropane-fatty-acyl-phospholipid synthase [Alphaproteobacteria bacterium]|nr:cyclopropane-fatty-acyl-phospholipid synthase [Alphaproteobacteria bacterium]
MFNRFVSNYINKICSKIEYGTLKLRFKNKDYFFQGQYDGPQIDMQIYNLSMFWDLNFRGSIGLGEAYIKKKFHVNNLSEFLEFGALNGSAFDDEMDGSSFFRFISKFYKRKTKNSIKQSKKNIHSHYDLGNQFYTTWLDDTLTYSSGFFQNGDETLSEAQIKKFESLITNNLPMSGDKVLEIGSGWGSFAFYLLNKFPDIQVDTLTISKKQFDYVSEKSKTYGFEKRLNVIYRDYREHLGQYNRVYSIEMFEAVGMEFWNDYFSKIRDLLIPKGVFSMQTIVIDNKYFKNYIKKIDFIQKYIFPGGMLPCMNELDKIAKNLNFTFKLNRKMADSYSKTLLIWSQNFNKKWTNLNSLGFPDEFKRTWNFYLSYCYGGFKAKTIDVYQIDFTKS